VVQDRSKCIDQQQPISIAINQPPVEKWQVNAILDPSLPQYHRADRQCRSAERCLIHISRYHHQAGLVIPVAPLVVT
jgi:hypothetical protein